MKLLSKNSGSYSYYRHSGVFRWYLSSNIAADFWDYWIDKEYQEFYVAYGFFVERGGESYVEISPWDADFIKRYGLIEEEDNF